tara:strand:- start:17 stop:175 length:159 start_codon:yes stop_codon:yes gene_type:complete
MIKNVNYETLQKLFESGKVHDVRGPKPGSYEYCQAAQGLNNKALWQVIYTIG